MGVYRNTTTITSDTILTSTNQNILVDVSGGAIQITLPNTLSADTRSNDLIKISHDFGDIITNNITIISNSGDTSNIHNGSVTLSTSGSSEIFELLDNGVWVRHIGSGAVSGTDTFVTGGTWDDNKRLATFTNTTGGTFDVVGITNNYLPLSGGTLTGDLSACSQTIFSSAISGCSPLIIGATSGLTLGDSIYLTGVSSNVGIGNAIPAAKLDVTGNAIVSGDLTVNVNTLFVDSGSNFVGINNTSPTHELTVNGSNYIRMNHSTSVGGLYAISNSNTNYYSLFNNRFDNAFPFQLYVNRASANILEVRNVNLDAAQRHQTVVRAGSGANIYLGDGANNVVIGTTYSNRLANADLDVEGDVHITNNLSSCISGGTISSGGTDLHDIFINGSGSTGTIGLFNENRKIGNSIITQEGTSGVTISGDLSACSQTIYSSALSGCSPLVIGSSEYVNLNNTLTVSGGTIGIGNTSPEATFHVNGTSKLEGATEIWGDGTSSSTEALRVRNSSGSIGMRMMDSLNTGMGGAASTTATLKVNDLAASTYSLWADTAYSSTGFWVRRLGGCLAQNLQNSTPALHCRGDNAASGIDLLAGVSTSDFALKVQSNARLVEYVAENTINGVGIASFNGGANYLKINTNTNNIGNQYFMSLQYGTTVVHTMRADGEVVFNEEGYDSGDFRVEGDTEEYLLFTDASSNSVNVGGTGDTESTLYVDGATGSTQFRLVKSYTPSGSGDTAGYVGSVAWDDNYIYIKTNSGWGRTSLDYGF